MNQKNFGIFWRMLFLLVILSLIFGYIFFRYNKLSDQRAEVTFFGLEEADAAIIQSDGKTMIIDTGKESDSAYIIQRLKDLNVSEIDLMLLTHPDKDHIGGASAIIDEFLVYQIIMPTVRKETPLEAMLLKKITELEIPVFTPCVKFFTMQFGDCVLEFYPGEFTDYRQINDFSICVTMTCGTQRAFFAGDIENKRMREFLNSDIKKCALVKIPHHGKDEKLSAAFVKLLKPKFAVVTANSAEPVTFNTLTRLKSEILSTTNGEIRFLFSKNKVKRMVS